MIEILEILDTGTEIATLAEAQTFFRSEGAENIEDALILELVEGARKEIEKNANFSLVDHSIKIYAENWRGFLPYPLVESITEVITYTGRKIPYIDIEDGIEINYTTIGSPSAEAKNAVLETAFVWYQRGGENRDIPERVKRVVRSLGIDSNI
jgi:hypothetical protein